MKTYIKNLLLLLLLLGLPAVVQAQFTYSTNADGSANIVHYTGPPWVVNIPTNINGLTVTSIGEFAFGADYSLTNITVDESNPAYSSMNGVLFDKAQATLIQFPGGLGGSYTIPNSVTSIGDEAFYFCTSLTNINVDASNPAYGSMNGVLFDKAQATLLQFPGGLGGSYTISNSVTAIGDYAFDDCPRLTSVTIPGSVTSIGYEAFAGENLTNVTIPNSVTNIGGLAFYGCTRLTNATIGNGVTSIGEEAFGNCTSLTSVTIPGSVTSIGEYAFWSDYSLTSVYFTGNAPSTNYDSTVFSEANGTVYYLPGTTGWGAKFDFLPTALWFLPNPVISNFEPNFGVQTNGFGFTISWATNVSVVVEAATNLANPVWIPVSTNTLTDGTNYFSDPQWTNYPERFYRVQLSP